MNGRRASIGQLKVADSATATEDRGYAYDPAWNLAYRTNNATLNTFTVDGKNQLTTSTPSGATAYDANGNLTSGAGGALTYGYDDENQLSLVQSNNLSTGYPVWRTQNYYDGLGRLRVRVECEFNAPAGGGGGAAAAPQSGGITPNVVDNGSWSTNNVTRYIYDGWRVIQERDGNNTPLVSYTRGTDLSGTLEGAGGIGGLLGRSTGNGTTWTTHSFYHADGNGNITFLVNSSQALAAKYRYDSYGNLISSSGTLAAANTYRFSSKMVDLKTGLYYYGYRWYTPSLQRWVNRDPIGEYGGLNLFSYVRNNPISSIDLFGLRIFPTAFVGPLLPGDQRGLSCAQYQALKKLLDRERKYGTFKAARMSSITFGDALLEPFNSSEGNSVPTYAGDMDLDWFTDVSALNYGGQYSTIPIYVAGKIKWTIDRLINRIPIGNAFPFQDQTERVAVIALIEDNKFENLFTPDFFNDYKPNDCECK